MNAITLVELPVEKVNTGLKKLSKHRDWSQGSTPSSSTKLKPKNNKTL